MVSWYLLIMNQVWSTSSILAQKLTTRESYQSLKLITLRQKKGSDRLNLQCNTKIIRMMTTIEATETETLLQVAVWARIQDSSISSSALITAYLDNMIQEIYE